MTILVTYHSHDGQTEKIATRIAAHLRDASLDVDAVDIRLAGSPNAYDAVVVGSPIRFERHHRRVTRYLERHRSELDGTPFAVFQVSMTSAQCDAEHVEKAASLLRKLVARAGVQPDLVEMFAGTIAYSKYGWVTKRVMRSIARREGNDTDTTRDHEYTDWDAVERFALEVAGLVRPGRDVVTRSSSSAMPHE